MFARRCSALVPRVVLLRVRAPQLVRRTTTECVKARGEFDLVKRAKKLGVRLSPAEMAALKEATRKKRGKTLKFTKADFNGMVRRDMVEWAERQTLVKYIADADQETAGQKLLLWLDYFGTALFAIVGTQVAGQAGMNVVGATFVGCVASTGGGVLNNLLTGNLRGGVFWVRNSNFLAIAFVASVLTFYLWPVYEDSRAKAEFRALRRAACPGSDDDAVDCATTTKDSDYALTLEQFERALERDKTLRERLFAAVKPHLEPEIRAAVDAAPSLGPALLFEWLDRERERLLRMEELKLVARLAVMSGPEMFFLETAALGAVAVIGAQAGVSRGLGPLPAIATGVTICFGGVLRDVLCHRDIALAAQSYAFATFAGSVVYVSLRQLVVRNVAPIPLLFRIFAGYATTVAQRVWVYVYFGGDESKALPPMRIYRPPALVAKASSELSSQVNAEELCEAAAQNDVFRLKVLTTQFSASVADYDRRTALHLAASEGSFEAVKFLVEDAAAPLSPLDRWHRTPLDDALDNDHRLVAHFLLHKGALRGKALVATRRGGSGASS